MKHLDLFSGIGGFALATEMVWDNVEHIFCDNEPFAKEILKKHWPSSPCFDDIRGLTINAFGDKHRTEYEQIRKAQEVQRVSWETLDSWGTRGAVDLLTGGFPCQPFSQAGRRLGTEDDRHLWPEMLRVIREFHPRWVIGENVGGLVTWSEGLVLEQIHTDLEGEGYEVQAFIIPAVAVNAPHRRDRVWIVANSKHEREGYAQRRGYDQGASVGTARSDTNDSNPNNKGLQGSEETRDARESGQTTVQRFREHVSWDKNWIEVATTLCRVHDGLPRRLDRTPRLKALGNAIVPQVAAEIMKVIKEVDLPTPKEQI